MKSTTITYAVLTGLAMAMPATAQDLTHKAAAQDKPIAIVNATIHTITDGTIENGHVVFDNGRITDIGEGSYTLRGVGTTIDASGKHIYPGLIGAFTRTGLTEIGAVRAMRDYSEVGGFKPEVRAAVSVNPDSTIIPVTRSNGILTVGVFPSGGRVSGRASVLQMDGWTWEDMTIKDDAGLILNWPNARPVQSRWVQRSEEEQLKRITKDLDAIDQFFDEADAYFATKAADPLHPIDVRYEAMRSIMPGAADQRPVFIGANDIDQIHTAVTWGAERGFKMVIVGGRDAALAAELLKEHDVGVIIGGTHKFPKRSDSNYDEAFALPAKLEAAGIKWCLSSGQETAHERSLPYNAATAVAYGLDHDAALESITIRAADLLGVSEDVGSLEYGKLATLIITDGDPLEIMTQTERAFVSGREIDLSNKQSKLDEKYREKYRQLGIIKDED